MSMDDVEEALYPLKRIVDRVGKQIEQFAANLDQFKPSDAEGTTPHQKACGVIREYQKIALETAEELKKSHETNQDQDEEDVEALLSEIKSWQQEARTWDLFASVLSIEDPEIQKRADEAEKHEFAIHRYSTDVEKWDYFLATDTFAQECVACLTWLQRTAEDDRESIEDAIATHMGLNGDEDLANSQGLLHTKEAIKAQKRLRSWPQPLDPDDPGIDVSLTRPSDKAPLITQLDPDAASRQGRKIRDSDQMYERAGWIASWEMLRRGRSWNQILEWSTERSEFWRAGSLKGANAEDDDPDGLSRFKNSRNHRLWQQMCRALARDGNMEAYEGSVYGLLGGEVSNLLNFFPGWSDRLFIHFNSAIVRLYSSFLQSQLEKTCPQDVDPDDFDKLGVSEHWIHQVVEALKRGEETKAEATLPFHLVQGAIMTKLYEEFFYSQGMAFSAIANATEVSQLYPKNEYNRQDDGFRELCGDRHLVRIVTHMMLILQSLGVLDIRDSLPDFENNTVAYIQFLQQAGRLELIPLYGSRLSKERSIEVLSRVFIDVTDHKEREQLVKLMYEYGIDVAKVLQKQALNVFQESLGDLAQGGKSSIPSNTVLSQRPGRQRITDIKLGFIGTEIDHMDELLIRSLEWHRCLDGHWAQICKIAITCYERCFGEYYPLLTISQADTIQPSVALQQPEKCASASSSTTSLKKSPA
jgi:nuclear pore complex protein Nup107